jgi:hypothetical protein
VKIYKKDRCDLLPVYKGVAILDLPMILAKNVLIHRESLIYKVIDTNNHEKEDY